MGSSARPSSIDAKIIVVGGPGVGKTSLAYCFAHDGRFVDNPSTIGANLLKRIVHVAGTDYRVHMQIWDTAGQERYRAISKIYYRGVSAAIFCYDLTSLGSYMEHEYWLSDIRTHAPDDVLIHVVGTKSDLIGPNDEGRQVPTDRCLDDVAAFFNTPNGGRTGGVGFEPGAGPAGLATSPAGGGDARPRTHRSSISVANVLNLRMLNSNTASANTGSNTGSGGSGSNNHGTGNDSQSSASTGATPARPRPGSTFGPVPAGRSHSDRCHEVSARRNDGVRDLFDRIARELVEQHIAKLRQKTVPAVAADPLPTLRPEKRHSWLVFRGDEPDRHAVSAIDGRPPNSGSNGACC